VGPPVLTINQGSTFMVSGLDGSISDRSELGIFASDTRFVSYWSCEANGEPWVRLTSGATAYNSCRIYLINPALITEEGPVEEGTLSLTIDRVVGEGVHEHLDLANYSQHPVRLNLEIVVRSDFADLFEVKERRFVRRGRIVTTWRPRAGELETSYVHDDFARRLVYRLTNDGPPPHYANGRVTFQVEVDAGAVWHACGDYILVERGRSRMAQCHLEGELSPPQAQALHDRWLLEATALRSANEDVHRLYRQSVEDVGALRLHDHDLADDVWLPAAGVPWFVTIFGRDSLIVSLQSMLISCGFVQGALKKLAQFQATEMDDWRDAEPGKILHEIRFGELAHFKKIPHTPYYGTHDATSLYLIALHEAWKWLGDDTVLRDYRDVALRCLEWIDRYGDLDGDGFQEYKTRSPQGYENMGWKDAADAVVYPDGSQVRQPKALCELQGYAFDAWMRMAEAFDALGEAAGAADLRTKAGQLRARFEEKFWCEDAGFYAFALDPDKRPVATIASNPGHCLWSGIASPEHAAKVVRRLLEPDMWSGWGVRTLSADNPAYSPFSYQRGSVWPHDNGIIALGFKRYGFSSEAALIARDIGNAASYFSSYRLPELWAGIECKPGTFPVLYRGANVPQAWAAGSVFHLLQAVLGLQADAPRGRLHVDPELPDWLADVTLEGMHVGHAVVDLRVWREDDGTYWDATVRKGSIEIEQQAWGPWSA
jgi:glycogen debranching enzyme